MAASPPMSTTASSPIRKRGRCDIAVEALDPSLPVIGSGPLSVVRKSRTSKWRASVLIGVHALIAAHITHFLIARRTLSPVEPSESMYTLEQGFLNCGFLFFAVALAGTLVFGRFFCGWACHIVALQDLCGWVMKKLGVRPRPFRSRLLAFTPLVLLARHLTWFPPGWTSERSQVPPPCAAGSPRRTSRPVVW